LLTRGDTVIHLSPKVFDFLLLLVANAGHLVEKGEIRRRIWPDTFVDDTNLAQHVSVLRKTLGEAESGIRYIETVPRIGYRFVADVQEIAAAHARDSATPAAEESSGETEQTANNRSSRLRAFPEKRWIGAGATLVIVLLATWGGIALTHSQHNSAIDSIAVLPLANLSGDPSQDYFADGMTDALITNLSKIPAVRVISRGSVMQYRNRGQSAGAIGRTLKVDAIVEGAVVRSGDRIRITAQLIRTSTDQNIWAEEYDRDYRDLLRLQKEVATDIAAHIRAQFTPQEKERQSTTAAVNPEAQDAYLKGRYFWNRRTEAGYLNAIKYFEEAIGRDSTFAPAYAGLADAYALLGSMPTTEITRADAMTRARLSAEQALQLDDSLAEAHTSLAFVKMHYDWDWQGAEHEFERALQLNPNYVTAHHWHAYNLIAMDRMDEAIAEMRYARVLDPLSPIINTDLGELLFYARRYDEALEQTKAAVALDPSFPLGHRNLERVYVAKKMFPEAIHEGETAVELAPDDRRMRGELAVTFAYAGRTHDARNLLAELLANPPKEGWTDLAEIYAAFGDTDELFAQLEKLYSSREGGLLLLKYEPTWFCCHSDPRFRDMLHRLGLPAK
jgi:TolB-like protein/DNA-binding winged helix-turn-helix (wHTH) protein/Tfp pilus assembly protein PilF